MARFRAYSKSTESDAAKVVTSTTSDDQTRTSSDGGRTTVTSSSGGGATSSATALTSSNVLPSETTGQAVHNHGLHNGTKLAVYGGKTEDGAVIAAGYENWVASGAHIHPAHSHTIPPHSHTVDDHTHRVTIPDHRHTITIPGHSHKVTVPSHSHSITPGIYQYGNPQKFGLYINGAKKADFSGRMAELAVSGGTTGRPRLYQY